MLDYCSPRPLPTKGFFFCRGYTVLVEVSTFPFFVDQEGNPTTAQELGEPGFKPFIAVHGCTNRLLYIYNPETGEVRRCRLDDNQPRWILVARGDATYYHQLIEWIWANLPFGRI